MRVLEDDLFTESCIAVMRRLNPSRNAQNCTLLMLALALSSIAIALIP